MRRASAIGVAALFMITAPSALPEAAAAAPDDIPIRHLDRGVDDADRAWIDRHVVGYAPADFGDGVKWLSGEPATWDELRGSVVLLQTWSRRDRLARTKLGQLERLRERYDQNDLRIIALHTPEGADGVDQYLERRPSSADVAVDTTGDFCDRMGAWKRPVNYLVGRNGVVRAAGLSIRGLTDTLDALIEESHDPDAEPPRRPEPSAEQQAIDWPDHDPGIRIPAKDMRGQQGPDLAVQEWLTPKPELEGKVLVIDFWATWCGPCIRAIPHMNRLQDAFPDEVVVLGLSDESPATVRQFLDRGQMDYTVAVDPKRRMLEEVQVRGIPHIMVMSADGVVRWQGFPPSLLDEEKLGEIVEANRKLRESGAEPVEGVSRNRWTTAGARKSISR